MKTGFLQRIKFQPRKIQISAIAFCLLLCATILALLFPPQTLSSTGQFQVKDLGQLPPIDPDTAITQTFEATDDLTGFGLLFANYNQVFDQGIIKIKVSTHQESVGTCSVEVRNLIDLSFFYCDLPLTEGQYYELLISTEDIASPITFLTTTAQIDHATLTINKKPSNQLIVMDFTRQRNSYMLAWIFAVLANLVFCYLAANIKKESHVSRKA